MTSISLRLLYLRRAGGPSRLSRRGLRASRRAIRLSRQIQKREQEFGVPLFQSTSMPEGGGNSPLPGEESSFFLRHAPLSLRQA